MIHIYLYICYLSSAQLLARLVHNDQYWFVPTKRRRVFDQILFQFLLQRYIYTHTYTYINVFNLDNAHTLIQQVNLKYW